jgi:hypothetical protein
MAWRGTVRMGSIEQLQPRKVVCSQRERSGEHIARPRCRGTRLTAARPRVCSSASRRRKFRRDAGNRHARTRAPPEVQRARCFRISTELSVLRIAWKLSLLGSVYGSRHRVHPNSEDYNAMKRRKTKTPRSRCRSRRHRRRGDPRPVLCARPEEDGDSRQDRRHPLVQCA